MAKLNKTQVYNNTVAQINELLKTSKVSKKFEGELLEILEANLAPKIGGGSSLHPAKLDDEGNIVEAWCKHHQRYEAASDMVMSNGKSKGYCKASISLWNKTNANIKKLDSQAVEAMVNGNFEKAQEIAKEAKEYKDNYNKPEFYDYDRDWTAFNGTAK